MSRVLIIEDHADIRRLLRWALEPDGHEVLEATTGQGGLDLMQAFEPDLVLLDVMMPGDMDGIQVCQRIRADPKLRHLPVVMVSARASTLEQQAALRAGADGFVAKPFSPLQLSIQVNQRLSARRPGAEPGVDRSAAAQVVDLGVTKTAAPVGPAEQASSDQTLIHCIYTSEATQELDEQSLANMLETIRTKNERLGLSGILLLAGNDFFQVLEGPAAVVDALYSKIASDPRHRRVTKIVRESIPNRYFHEWTMGFAKFSDSDLAMALGANDFFRDGRCLAELDQGRAKKLLEAFREGRWRQSLAGRRESMHPQTLTSPARGE